MQLDPVQVGILSSVVTEILKFFPKLNSNPLYPALVAIAVNTLGVLFLAGGGYGNLGTALITSFATYQMILQPAAKTIGLSTQS